MRGGHPLVTRREAQRFALVFTVVRRVWREQRPIGSLGGRSLRLRWWSLDLAR